MKKFMSLFLTGVLAMCFLTACGKAFQADTNTVYVQKNGKITAATIEKFDKEYYDADELEKFVNEKVDSYQADHDKDSVKVDKYSVEKDVASLYLMYAGYQDYASFNEAELFTGSIPEAMAAGYGFDEEFTKIEEGKAGSKAEKDDVLEDDSFKVVILSGKTDVKVDGTIRFVTSGTVSIKEEGSAAVKLPKDAGEEEEPALSYIIYE